MNEDLEAVIAYLHDNPWDTRTLDESAAYQAYVARGIARLELHLAYEPW